MIPYVPAPTDLAAHRGSDDRLAHVGPGEIVIPREVSAAFPALAQAVLAAYGAMGGDPATAIVGSPDGNYNPATGNQEFFFNSLLTSVAPALGAVVGGALPYGNIIAPLAAGGLTYALGGSAGEAIGAGAGAALGGYAAGGKGQTLDAAFGTDIFGNYTTGDVAGYGLGALLGSQIGGMFDQPQVPSFDFGGGGSGEAGEDDWSTISPNIGTGENPNFSPVGASAALPGGGAGVSYISQVKDRNTGEMRDIETGQPVTAFARANRRGGWGNVVTI